MIRICDDVLALTHDAKPDALKRADCLEMTDTGNAWHN